MLKLLVNFQSHRIAFFLISSLCSLTITSCRYKDSENLHADLKTPSSHHLPIATQQENYKSSQMIESDGQKQNDSINQSHNPHNPHNPQNSNDIKKFSLTEPFQGNLKDAITTLCEQANYSLTIHTKIQKVLDKPLTLTIKNKVLTQILQQLTQQADFRYIIDDVNQQISLLPDEPYLQSYVIDYLNMSRESHTQVNIATQIATTGQSANSNAGGSGNTGVSNNNSITTLTSHSQHDFWKNLAQNLRDILQDTDKVLPKGSTETTIEQQQENGDLLLNNGLNSLNGFNNTNGININVTKSSGKRNNVGNDVVIPAPNNLNNISNSSNISQNTNNINGVNGILRDQNAVIYNPTFNYKPKKTQKIKQNTFKEAASVIVNPESGLITVRARQQQQQLVQFYLEQISKRVQKQVLMEATIVEVQLNHQYQAGINWQELYSKGAITQQPFGNGNIFYGNAQSGSGPIGVGFTSGLVAGATNSNPIAGFLNWRYQNGNFQGALSLLESFGKIKVLSSPKLSVLNNQTALLKVVDNKVYFTIQVQIVPPSNNNSGLTTYQTTVNTIPVGLVMNITPQISDSGVVTVNLRPTISRIVGYVNDPSPALALANVVSRIPEVQTREMESIMSIPNGETAILGGLMQDNQIQAQDGVPGLGKIAGIGRAFRYEQEQENKSELIIFLRPQVVETSNNWLKVIQPFQTMN